MHTLLRVHHLNKAFTNRVSLFKNHHFYAVRDLSFTLKRGETLAIIGENGAGKSTAARMLAGLTPPTSGEIFFEDQPLEFGDYAFRARHIRMIFQDPNETFAPNSNFGQILDTPLRLHFPEMAKTDRNNRIFETLLQVGLAPEYANLSAQSASASQKQRLAMARALILNPEIIIIDDSLNTLDFSVKTQLINLMLSLQKQFNLSYLYLGQNLGLIKHIADNLLVMHQGEMLEYGSTQSVMQNPQHPVTQRLIESYFGQKLSAENWQSTTVHAFQP